MKWIIRICESLANWWYRYKLRNEQFTIITNTCIAGIMYHKLGKQFLSPTINLWMHDEDFLKFVHHLDEYLEQPLQFIKSEMPYPVANCGDVTIYFNHYISEAEAEVKWKERIKRINKDNLFIICSDRPKPDTGKPITHEDMLSLKEIPCRGKVIFSTRHYDDMDYIVPLPKDPNGDYVNIYMRDKSKYIKRYRWEDAWDWVHWLNTGEVKLRKCKVKGVKCMKRALIIFSVVLNIVLLAALYYVACVKTDFSKRMMAKINQEAYVPERQDDCCVDSWNNCISKLDMEVDVVFFGDSHTAGGNWQRAFPDVKSINLGYIGEDVKGMLRRVDAIKAVKPKKVFLMAGINGLQQQTMEDFEYWYSALVDAIRREVPEAELYIESILPVTSYSDYCDKGKIQEANVIVRKIAEERALLYIDLYSQYAVNGALPDTLSFDGLHLREEAYSLWYESINSLIR